MSGVLESVLTDKFKLDRLSCFGDDIDSVVRIFEGEVGGAIDALFDQWQASV